jgi:homoserine O-succinyltransferase
MAIILPQDHPAFSRLESQGVAVKSAEIGARVIDLGFVNVMPAIYLDETLDLLLTRLAKSSVDVRPTFISPESNQKKGDCWYETDKSKIDCFLITGYAQSDMAFDELHFGSCLKTILNHIEENNLPLFAVCAGAMFAANHYYGIAKEQAPHKLLGNYEYKTHGGQSVYLATSRNNTLSREDLLKAVRRNGLCIDSETTQTPQPEPGVLVDYRRNIILAFAHLEYAYTKSDSYPGFEGIPLDIMTYQFERDHAPGPKFCPELAARVKPPANPELSTYQVQKREEYAEKLLSGWVEQTARLKYRPEPSPCVLHAVPLAAFGQR